MRFSFRAPIVLATFLFASAALSWGQPSKDAAPKAAAPKEAASNPARPSSPGAAKSALAADKGVLLVDLGAPAEAELKSYAENAALALTREFGDRGLSLARSADPPAATQRAAAAAVDAAKDALSRWALVLRARLEGRRLSWSFSLYDAATSALIAADSFSAVAGLSALPLFDSSARSTAAAWEKAKGAALPPEPIAYRLRFESSDAGVALRFSSASVSEREAGATVSGVFEAAYAPFLKAEPLTVRLSKEGYWPRTLELRKGPSEAPIRLPRLQKKTSDSLTFNIAANRPLGAEAAYRHYFSPDAWFVNAANALWLTNTFAAGSNSVLHDEVRLGVGGSLFPLYGPFRVTVGIGVSAIGTWLPGASGYELPLGLDLLIEPFSFTIEYHQPTWAIVLEERLPYSLGLGTGFLEQGWSSVGNSGPMFLSLGVMLKW